MRSVLKGAECTACESFSIRKLRSCLSLFSRELRRALAPGGSGPTAAKARSETEIMGLRSSWQRILDEVFLFTIILPPTWAICWMWMFFL